MQATLYFNTSKNNKKQNAVRVCSLYFFGFSVFTDLLIRFISKIFVQCYDALWCCFASLALFGIHKTLVRTWLGMDSHSLCITTLFWGNIYINNKRHKYEEKIQRMLNYTVTPFEEECRLYFYCCAVICPRILLL